MTSATASFAVAGHPIAFVSAFLTHCPDIREVELSAYRYQPQSVTDERSVIRVPAAHLRQRFEALQRIIPKDWDVAFHSRVVAETRDGPRIMHIPLIDFRGELDQPALTAVRLLLLELGVAHAALVSSGRSFHLYAQALLSPEAWVSFMGRILLLNEPHGRELVDSRWVGHRLIAGYASLRWTKRGPRYVDEPILIDHW
jgi:hypothetical protein